uniref:Uncharacterized protein n=1 Tax=Timema douglasi TaxID=61478 RepID=A0A7R8VBK6_TIMDO|nr:unnamed protein product [Timema douglasi]
MRAPLPTYCLGRYQLSVAGQVSPLSHHSTPPHHPGPGPITHRHYKHHKRVTHISPHLGWNSESPNFGVVARAEIGMMSPWSCFLRVQEARGVDAATGVTVRFPALALPGCEHRKWPCPSRTERTKPRFYLTFTKHNIILTDIVILSSTGETRAEGNRTHLRWAGSAPIGPAVGSARICQRPGWRRLELSVSGESLSSKDVLVSAKCRAVGVSSAHCVDDLLAPFRGKMKVLKKLKKRMGITAKKGICFYLWIDTFLVEQKVPTLPNRILGDVQLLLKTEKDGVKLREGSSQAAWISGSNEDAEWLNEEEVEKPI